MGFPCNQFGAQEPGTEEEIEKFACTKFKASFPLMKKIDVNGANADPLFEHVKTEAKGIFGTTSVKWNFTKFLGESLLGHSSSCGGQSTSSCCWDGVASPPSFATPPDSLVSHTLRPSPNFARSEPRGQGRGAVRAHYVARDDWEGHCQAAGMMSRRRGSASGVCWRPWRV